MAQMVSKVIGMCWKILVDSCSLSIEPIANMCMSLQETMIKLQNEVHDFNESKMMLQHMVDSQ